MLLTLQSAVGDGLLAQKAKKAKEREARRPRSFSRHSWPTAEGIVRQGVVVLHTESVDDELSGAFIIRPDKRLSWIVSYKGELVNRVPKGKGTAIFETGDTYDGEWHNGFREGYGEMLYANGDVYKGQWKDGRRSGQGIYSKNRKDYVKGDFVDGIPHGIAVCYIDGIKVYNGRWTNGKPQHPENVKLGRRP